MQKTPTPEKESVRALMRSQDTRNKQPEVEHLKSLFKTNIRLLEILLTKKLLSNSKHSRIKAELTRDMSQGKQIPLEQLPALTDTVAPERIIQEHFKYNQIIIKLAQQFTKNTLAQKLRTEETPPDEIQHQLNRLDVVFSEMLTKITSHYLNGLQDNIDDTLLASGMIQPAQLEFLHNGARHLEIKALDRKFGEIAIKNEYATQTAVSQALAEQTNLYLKTHENHMIGDILVRKKEMAPEIRDEILLIQNRVREEDWEQMLRNVGQSAIEEQEKNALFGALVIKEKLMKETQVIEALKTQNKEKLAWENSPEDGKKPPRWLGDILVDDFGLSDDDRKRVIKKQMQQKIELINLKFGINLKDAQKELFHELDTIFEITYSKSRLQASVTVIREIPDSLTRDNIILWLYHKNIIYGRKNPAISRLAGKKITPGETIVVAKGDPPVRESFTAERHVEMSQDTGQSYPVIVTKGTPLATVRREPGKSGIGVNRCFISPQAAVFPLTAGVNVKRENGTFVAKCDGVPSLSESGVISISPKVRIYGDLTENDPAFHYNCDLDLTGTVVPGCSVKCRLLRAGAVKGRILASGDVTVNNETREAEIIAKGSITLSTVMASRITAEKNITIHMTEASRCRVVDATVSCNDTVSITDTDLEESVIRARKTIILRKTTVGPGCRFAAGDSNRMLSFKLEIEKRDVEIKRCIDTIQSLQDEIRDLFQKIGQKDISGLEDRIKALNGQATKTREDLEKIRELKREKRKKEREFEKQYNECGDEFFALSSRITAAKTKKADLEKDRKDLENKLAEQYQEEKGIPEIDARRATLARGTVIQFRHTRLVLDDDYKGFVFREEYNGQTKRFEIRQHRW